MGVAMKASIQESGTRSLLFTIGLVALVGCHDPRDVTMPIGDPALRLRNQIASAAAARRPTIDDRFAALAREVPGFGGMYYDSTGTLTVLL
jgi:hypothetical protein